MIMHKKQILIIGMGNILMQDEGVGVRAVEELDNSYVMPNNVTLIDGGTIGMELFEPIRNCDRLIVADAVNTGAPNGALVRIANDEIPAFFQTKLSSHQLGLSDILASLALKEETPKHIVIIGMVPYALENHLGLTAKAEAGLGKMVQMLVAELSELGVLLKKRAHKRASYWHNESELKTPCA